MARKRKLIKIRKPKVTLTKRGLKVSKPSARIGNKVGVNVSSKGVSTSVKTGKGYLNISKRGVRGRIGNHVGANFDTNQKTGQRKRTKKGCLPGCGLVLLVPLFLSVGHILRNTTTTFKSESILE